MKQEPTASPITMFTQVKRDVPPLEWSWVEQRLVETEDYWVVTSGDVPAPRPLWGVWMDDRLLFTVGSASHRRNVERNPAVAVHLGDAHEVVVVEGTGSWVTEQPTLDRLVEVYNPKYGWNFEPGQPGRVLAVDPSVVLAWTVAPNAEARTSPFPLAASKFIFSG